ncbi:hypothetical protein [Vagococcus zengguangii]|uniref:Uncharacterized protein n=1 Tax=Vagococcus zengguangii TaxID=2571750 RepID=A0A4D7CUV8_9ENTE|nr:hypothetical protein [Vagococcus zengguangii]QCI86070.1 hypothetical protein FA707_03450 [Vagococcus zengguangii]TLG80187.1 hypothetical protein FE258_05715 [Vagococcus zengguangii]
MDEVKQSIDVFLNKLMELSDKIEIKHKKIIIAFFSVLASILLFLCILPPFQAKVREKQVNNLLISELTDNKYYLSVAPDELVSLIKNNNEISLLMIDQTDSQKEAITNLVHNDQDKKAMTQPVYVYPMIYNNKEIKDFFKLSKGATLIHFKKATETFRVNFKSAEEIEFHFYDYLEAIANQK